jgi:hypothetical protein
MAADLLLSLFGFCRVFLGKVTENGFGGNRVGERGLREIF